MDEINDECCGMIYKVCKKLMGLGRLAMDMWKVLWGNRVFQPDECRIMPDIWR